MKAFGKYLQRRTFSFLNTCWGFSFFCLLLYLLLVPLVEWLTTTSVSPCRLRGNGLFCSEVDYSNNIGNIRSEHFIAHQPIDIVYTWVNGSDPVWKAKKEFWLEKTFEIPPKAAEPAYHNSSEGNTTVETVITSNTTESNNNSTTETVIEASNEIKDEESETATANRYRDSEELRFSLRSLIRHAPWIRHIYLVTDNQIPYWLNLETPQLSVVSHDEIFPDKNDLPVFSSPAIEAHLHRIRSLSKRFIYFNDDVFLGAPVLPDDFVSLSGAQKLYMAWEVPKCAPGCSDSWIGDGYCDRACNVSSCNFDYPDCINGSNVQGSSSLYGTGGSANSPGLFCSRQCPDTWIADKICDQRCKNSECGYDAGDCGLDLVLDNYEGVLLEHGVNSLIITPSDAQHNAGEAEDHMILNDDYSIASRGGYDTHTGDYHSHHYGSTPLATLAPIPQAPALSIPYGNTHVVYFNLSQLPCHASNHSGVHNDNNSAAQAQQEHCNLTAITEQGQWKYLHAEHDDESHWAIQQSVLLQKHHLLLVLLYHEGQGQEGTIVPKPLYYPYTIAFTVTGKLGETGEEYTVSFLLELVDEATMIRPENLLPDGVGKLEVDSLGHQLLIDGQRNDRDSGGMIRLLPVPLVALTAETTAKTAAATSAGTNDTKPIDIDSPHRSDTMMKFDEQWLLAVDKHVLHAIAKNHSFASLCLSNAVVTSSSTGQHYHLTPAHDNHSCLPLQLALFDTTTAKFTLAHYGDHQMEYSKAYSEYVQSPLISLEYDRPAAQRLRQHIRYHPTNDDDQVLVLALPPLPIELRWSRFDYGWIHLQFELSTSSVVHANDNIQRKKIVVSAIMKWGHPNNSTIVDAVNSTENVSTQDSLDNTSEYDRTNVSSFQRRRRRLLLTVAYHAAYPSTVMIADVALSIVNYYLRPVYWLLGIKNKQANIDSDEHALQQQLLKPKQQQRRKLLDTYALSLIHVNRLYTQAFGPDSSRKVPAHIPHMIDRDLLQEAQNLWPVEWNATSKHRFRSKDDMQFSFAYYHYTINRHKLPIALPTPLTVLQELVDTNGDHQLDDNELRTLATLITVGQQPIVAIDDLKQCITKATPIPLSSEFHAQHIHTRHKRNNKRAAAAGRISKTIKYARHPTLTEALSCPMIMSAINNTNLLNGLWHHRWQPQPIQESDRESVAFEMIGDNATHTVAQLDSVRARQPKFICINDNMQAPSSELEQALRSFFETLYPVPSQFELLDGKRNPTLYLDEYRRLTKQQHLSSILNPAAQALSGVYNAFAGIGESVRKAIRHVLKALLQATASSTQTSYTGVDDDDDDVGNNINQQQEMIAIHKLLRRDAATNPLATAAGQQQGDSSVSSWAHLVAWLSVFGLLAVIALRRGIITRRAATNNGRLSNTSSQLPFPTVAIDGDYEAAAPSTSSTVGRGLLTRRWTLDETGRATQQLNSINNNEDAYSASQTNLLNSVQVQELELESQAASELARRYASDELNFSQQTRNAQSTTEIVAGIIGVENDGYIIDDAGGDD